MHDAGVSQSLTTSGRLAGWKGACTLEIIGRRARGGMGLLFVTILGYVTIAVASTEELLEAAATGRTETLERLLRSGASPDARDAQGRTALMIAAFNGHEAAVTALGKGGAHVSLGTPDGDTALMAAAFRGHYGVARQLLLMGAEAQQRTRDGTSPTFAQVR